MTDLTWFLAGSLAVGGFVVGSIVTAAAMTLAPWLAKHEARSYSEEARQAGYLAGARGAYDAAHRILAEKQALARQLADRRTTT